MPPQLLVDLSRIDFNKIQIPKEKIHLLNPQRFEMDQLDGIFRIDFEEKILVGYRDIRADEFWVKGHIPGRPLFPGILMIECAAQLSSYYFKASLPPGQDNVFVGFGGVTDVKFRGTVNPGDRLIMMGKCIDLRSRRAVFATQGIVNGQMVFEATIIGMPV